MDTEQSAYWLNLDIGKTHRALLEKHKQNTNIPFGTHIMRLIDEDVVRNPDKYGNPVTLSVKINSSKTVKDKVATVMKHFHKELSVRGITSILASYVAPMDRDTLRVLVKQALDDAAIYYASRTDGRVNKTYGLLEWR